MDSFGFYKRANGKKFKEGVGEDLYRKLTSSILRAQSEIVRIYDLPVGGCFISFEENVLVWSIVGEIIPASEKVSFYMRDDRDDIRQHAIQNLRRHQKLSSRELKNIDIYLGEGSKIIIRKASKEPVPIYPSVVVNDVSLKYFTKTELAELGPDTLIYPELEEIDVKSEPTLFQKIALYFKKLWKKALEFHQERRY